MAAKLYLQHPFHLGKWNIPRHNGHRTNPPWQEFRNSGIAADSVMPFTFITAQPISIFWQGFLSFQRVTSVQAMSTMTSPSTSGFEPSVRPMCSEFSQWSSASKMLSQATRCLARPRKFNKLKQTISESETLGRSWTKAARGLGRSKSSKTKSIRNSQSPQ